METNKLEEEIIRSFSRVFLRMERFYLKRNNVDLEELRASIQQYEEIKKDSDNPYIKIYDDTIKFTLDNLGINIGNVHYK